MEKQSGFPVRRTESGLSARLRVMSESPESSKQTRWPKRYDTKYTPQDNYKSRVMPRSFRDKREYHNR